MGKIAELFRSRKFWTALGAIVGLLGTGFTGVQPWPYVIAEIVGVVVTWINSQSRVDAAVRRG